MHAGVLIAVAWTLVQVIWAAPTLAKQSARFPTVALHVGKSARQLA